MSRVTLRAGVTPATSEFSGPVPLTGAGRQLPRQLHSSLINEKGEMTYYFTDAILSARKTIILGVRGRGRNAGWPDWGFCVCVCVCV